MSKNISRSKSVMSRFKGRDVTASTASLRVTDDAQARVRPSTSGGTKKSTGNLPSRSNTDKRETRDDLFFNPLRAHGKDGPSFDNFPLPSNRRPPSPVVPQIVESLTYSPESIEKSRTVHPNVGGAEIGTALGSSACPPENWPQVQKTFEIETSTSNMMDDTSHYDDSAVAAKHKKGRKWFGLFGNKKVPQTPTTFYQFKPESQQEIPTIDLSSPEAKCTGRSRGRSISCKTGKKSDIKRAQTAPITPALQHPFKASTSTTIHAGPPDHGQDQHPYKASTSTTIQAGPPDHGQDQHPFKASTSTTIQAGPPDIHDQGQHPFQASTSTTIEAGTPEFHGQGPIEVEVLQSYPKVSLERPKLDIALPAVAMERYSVMFGDILPSPSTTTSPLLERRQATLDRLKNVEQELATKEAELEARTKAVSKHMTISPQSYHNIPSLSLFPNTPTGQCNHENLPTQKEMSLHRSNTSPAGHSPSRPSFALGLDNNQHADLAFDNGRPTGRHEHEHTDYSSSTSTKKPREQSERSSPGSRRQLQTARTWSPEKSQFLSPSSTEEPEGNAHSINDQDKEDLNSASPLTATKSKFEGNQLTWHMVNSKKQNHGAPSSVSGSTTSEASTVSSSHSTASFSSIPGGVLKSTIPMSEEENVKERDSRKISPTNIRPPQPPQKDKETKLPVKSASAGPRPIISAFNTTTRSSGSTPRPILKSHISENQDFKPILASSSSLRPSIQKSSSESLVSAISPRPTLQKSPMTCSNLSSTNSSLPRKNTPPVSPYPKRSTSIAVRTPSSKPKPEASYNIHQKQASTCSIAPSLLNVQIDETLHVPGSRSRDPEQKRLETAAGLSIARQISVSRQQRRLLIPITTSGTISKRNPRDRSPGMNSPSDRQSEQSPVSAGPGIGKRIVTIEEGTEKKGLPLSMRGGGLSSAKSQSGSNLRGIGISTGGSHSHG
ncbi:hypothetical protein NHQ30_006020 [Ciborinia camelliae]|nr:hypothetical protein NHQ30_006020 [Ciborinia camelliae]